MVVSFVSIDRIWFWCWYGFFLVFGFVGVWCCGGILVEG